MNLMATTCASTSPPPRSGPPASHPPAPPSTCTASPDRSPDLQRDETHPDRCPIRDNSGQALSESPMPSSDAVEIDDVTKAYEAVVAVDGLSLRVPRGSVYGFIGPNGSG